MTVSPVWVTPIFVPAEIPPTAPAPEVSSLSVAVAASNTRPVPAEPLMTEASVAFFVLLSSPSMKAKESEVLDTAVDDRVFKSREDVPLVKSTPLLAEKCALTSAVEGPV